jgi:O-antigen ligase
MNALTRAAWCAAIFLAADLFSHTVALRLIALGLGVVSIVVALFEARLRKAPLSFDPVPPLWIPFALWGAWAGLSYFWSVEPARTAKEFINEIVYTALAFWMCWCAAQAKGAARIILPVVALAAVGACGSAIYYFGKGILAYGYGPHSDFGQAIVDYAYGPHGGAGNHSSAIVTLMPCVLAVGWLAWRSGSRWLVFGCLALGALFLVSGYTTLNRMFWIVIAVQLVMLGAFLIGRARKHRAASPGRSATVATVVLALAVIAAGATVMLRVQQERAESNFAVPLASDPRLALWAEVIERIRERPVLGYGFGRGILRTALRKELNDGSLWHSHNLLLDAALQSGLIGLALLGALLFLTLRQGWRLSHVDDTTAAALGMALVAVVLGMVMRNMTDYLWVRQNALLYWGVVGGLLGLSAARGARRVTGSERLA